MLCRYMQVETKEPPDAQEQPINFSFIVHGGKNSVYVVYVSVMCTYLTLITLIYR